MNSILKVSNIFFSYNKAPLLSNCSFELNRNSITALLGCNGHGKTTLMNCIMKYLNISSGCIKIDNYDIANISIKELSQKISYVPQINEYSSSCVIRDFLVEGRTPYLSAFTIQSQKDYELVDIAAKSYGIYKLLDKKLDEVSGGEKQLVFIVRALIQNTPFIMMDEPMSALDLSNQKHVLNILEELKKEGKTILFSTHNPNHALFLNCNCLVLKNGLILREGPASTVLDQDIIKELYGDSIGITNLNNKKICYFN